MMSRTDFRVISPVCDMASPLCFLSQCYGPGMCSQAGMWCDDDAARRVQVIHKTQGCIRLSRACGSLVRADRSPLALKERAGGTVVPSTSWWAKAHYPRLPSVSTPPGVNGGLPGLRRDMLRPP